MNKRRKKKLMRHACPKCRRQDGIWKLRQLKTGRWVEDFVSCFYCDMGGKDETA